MLLDIHSDYIRDILIKEFDFDSRIDYYSFSKCIDYISTEHLKKGFNWTLKDLEMIINIIDNESIEYEFEENYIIIENDGLNTIYLDYSNHLNMLDVQFCFMVV